METFQPVQDTRSDHGWTTGRSPPWRAQHRGVSRVGRLSSLQLFLLRDNTHGRSGARQGGYQGGVAARVPGPCRDLHPFMVLDCTGRPGGTCLVVRAGICIHSRL
jgi:hypothetical protein